MRPSMIPSVLRSCRTIGKVCIIAGPFGSGKSSVVDQYAKAEGMGLLLSHPATWDATDSRGVPVPDVAEAVAHWFPMADLARIVKATVPTVWCLEDLGQAPIPVQTALMQIFLARRIGDHVIPNHVQICATTNRVGERSAVALPVAALKDRAFIVSYECSVDDFSRWGASNGVSPDVLGYLAFAPQHLHSISPVNDWAQDGSTPRGWADVSAMLGTGLPAEIEEETIAGRISQGIASEFCAFLRVRRDLPDLDLIIAKPEKTKVPAGLSARYAVACALAGRAKLENLAACETYLKRITDSDGVPQREFRLLFWRIAQGRDKALLSSPEMSAAAKDFKDITLR